jgi:hypothetical protein
MADTIYTPSEMLDRVEARTASLRRELAMLDAWIEEATLEGDTNRARRLTEERAMCAADIALLFQNVI